MRRCVGCGRRAPQSDLIRFAARDGFLVRGRTVPGRGVYTCRSLGCYELAATRGMFARVLRQQVQVGPELRRLYTGESHG